MVSSKYYLPTILKLGEIFINVNYSENYTNKKQQEIQSTYFGQETFSIFTTCCCLRDANSDLINRNVSFQNMGMKIVTSEKLLHLHGTEKPLQLPLLFFFN